MGRRVQQYNPYKRAFYDSLLETSLFGFFSKFTSKPYVSYFFTNAPLNIFVFWLVVLLITFGIGYQTMPVLLFPAVLVLVIYSRSVPSGWYFVFSIFPALSIGTFLAFAGNFSANTNPWEAHDTIYMVPIACVSSFLICVCLMVDRAAATSCYYMLPFVEIFFAFPTIWAGFWMLIYHFSPFGDAFNWGYALAFIGIDPLTLGATWICGAIAGNSYLFGIVVSATIYLMRRAIEISRFENSKIRSDDETRYLWASTRTEREQANWFFHPVAFAIYILIVIFTAGSFYQVFGPNSGFFYQTPIQNYAKPTVQISCLIRPNIESTRRHLQTNGVGSKFVVWSEDSVVVSENKEAELISNAMELSAQFQTYIGLSYLVNMNGTKFRNMFTMVAPQLNQTATVAFKYQKANPVPIVEDRVEAGPRTIPFVDTIYGRVGAAICFDMDFYSLNDAATAGIEIMLQPSATWGPVGPSHAFINRLRAVENGFTLFRCSSNGISGVYDPFFRILNQQTTLGAGSWFVHQVPLYGKQFTPYRFFPGYLEIICLAFFVFWVSFLVGWWVLKMHRRYFKKRERNFFNVTSASPSPSTDTLVV